MSESIKDSIVDTQIELCWLENDEYKGWDRSRALNYWRKKLRELKQQAYLAATSKRRQYA